jgi:hypothetical protein
MTERTGPDAFRRALLAREVRVGPEQYSAYRQRLDQQLALAAGGMHGGRWFRHLLSRRRSVAAAVLLIALIALTLLLLTAPEGALALLDRHLKPVPAVEPQRLERLLAALDHPRFAPRRKALQELEALGALARPALERTLAARPSLEVRRRAEQLLQRLDEQSLTTEEIRQDRAIEVLERLATPAARQLLQRLASGAPGAHLTESARSALQRLSR